MVDVQSAAKSQSDDMVTLLLQATGNAPQLKKKKWTASRSKTMAWVVNFLRGYIACAPNESLFIYVNQCFAPSLDTEIGTLFDCYSAEAFNVKYTPLHRWVFFAELAQIYLDIETCNVFCDFLESVINCYLFQRGVYPRAAFTSFNVFGVQIQVCMNPDVKSYIYDCIESLRPRISLLRELRVNLKLPLEVIGEEKRKYLESLILRFDGLNEEFIRRDLFATVLREYFATALLRLCLLECNYPPYDFETTWEVCVRLASADSGLSNATPMSWYLSDQSKFQTTRSTINPIVSFDNSNVQMQLLLEQTTIDPE